MKHSVKVMSFVMALSGTTAMVPQASAQTQPAKTQQPSQAQQHENTHSRAKGAAAGAAVGAISGNAGNGAAPEW
jgi:hypothetical protein